MFRFVRGLASTAKARLAKAYRRSARRLKIPLWQGKAVSLRAARRLGVWRPGSADHVIVSLTTFPLRIGKVHHVISSLLAQSLLPRKVVLYLSLPEFPDRAIPKSLARLIGDRFEIRFQPENLRSYNKLQFALRDFPERWIATCDDDRLYDANWLARLVRVAAEHPRTVVSTVGRRMIVDGDRFLPYQDWPYDHSAIPSFLLFPVGSWGILYPPGSLHPAIADRNLISELAPLDDDSWFKAMSLMQNVPCRAVGGKYSMPSLKFEHNVRLWDLNQRGPLMDEALQRVFGHFGLTAAVLIAKESTLRSPKNV